MSALAAPPTPRRQLDRRTEASDLRLELFVRLSEAEAFATRVRTATYRITKMLDGELYFEAQQVADGLYHEAGKALRRLEDPEKAA